MLWISFKSIGMKAITVTSHECCGVSNHLKIECSTVFSRANITKTLKLHKITVVDSSFIESVIRKTFLCVSIIRGGGEAWWRHQMETFFALLALCEGNHWSLVVSPYKGQLHRALLFSFICAWTNGWANSQDADDFRHHCTHYDVTVTTNSPPDGFCWQALKINWRKESKHCSTQLFLKLHFSAKATFLGSTKIALHG